MRESGELRAIQELYDRGLYLQAYRLARERGPLTDWRGPAERVLAGRLAHNLGGRRTGTAIHLRAWREHPDCPEAHYFHARAILECRGPLKAWRFFQQSATDPVNEQVDGVAPTSGNGPGTLSEGLSLVLLADRASLRAHILGELRDFDAADRWMDRALEILPRHSWTLVEKAWLLELEDRYEEALEVARQSLEWYPWFRPSVALTAHLLHLLGKDEEALTLLEEGCRQLESGHVLLQLADIQQELGRFADARATLERVEEYWPLMDEKTSNWVKGRLSDATYLCGDIVSAARLAAESGDPFHKQIHEMLTSDRPDQRRVLLDVEFVRQHHVTCAPATLTALSRFWSMPADHLEVAEEICYDGTPFASERRWANEHGWVAREFRLTWESAVLLIDRQVPFTLTTVEPASSHLQAVVGYDGYRGVLLIRDPYHRGIREFLADRLIERYEHVGPRAMVLVPVDQARLLQGLELPDASLYDVSYELDCALRRHDRAAADGCCARMETQAPEHRLTIEARLSLAVYDADLLSELHALDKLAAKYPESDHWRMLRAHRLMRLGRREEFFEILEAAARRPGVDPVILEQYAVALQEDARRLPEALRLTDRIIRVLRERAGGYYVRGNMLWDLRRFEEALEVYRFGCCLDDKNEQLAWAYFTACRHFKRTQEALDFLMRRFERFHHKSCGPIRTLFYAMTALDRTGEAFERVDQALLLRPDDGELILFAAEAFARYGRYPESSRLLDKSRGKCKHADWLRTSARLMHYKGELRDSLDLWRQVLETEPLAMDAHRCVAARLIDTEGREAALVHLQKALDRFSHHRELQELLVECLGTDDPAATEVAVRRLLEVDPLNAWAMRELAIVLTRQQRFDEALVAVEKAGELDPHNPGYRNVRGLVLKLAGRVEEAREEFRRAIVLTVDNDYAIKQLLDLADSLAQRREALRLVKDELVRQVMFGSGILEYGEQAAGTLAPEEVLAVLGEALEARPDLWQTRAALVRHLSSMDRLDEAHALALKATEEFPLVPETWLDLAGVCRLRLDRDGEVGALEQARAIRRGWAVPVRLLADVYDREGRFKECCRLMEQAVAQEPTDPVNHGYVADALWKLGEKSAAMERLEQAITLDPDYEWAWNRLHEWAQEAGREDLPVRMARHVTERRGGDARSWTILATMLGAAESDEALKALDRALELDPRSLPAHDLRAEILAGIGRYDEALEACRPDAWEDSTPVVLQGRAAWVEAARGRLETAIRLMKEALALDESYMWGWSTLAEWYDAAGDNDGVATCAEHMVKLQPNSVTALGLLGHALLKRDDTDGARAAFARAVSLAPDYAYAVDQLLHLLLTGGHLEEAESTLERCVHHMPVPIQLCHRIRILVKRGLYKYAQGLFQQLIRTGDVDSMSLNLAATDLASKVPEVVDRALEDAVKAGEARPHAAVLLIQRQATSHRWRDVRRTLASLEDGEAWRAAVRMHLRLAGEALRRREVDHVFREYESRLARETSVWAITGYALNSVNRHARCVAWLSDWRHRDDLGPWMLENLAHSLWYLQRQAEAVAVSKDALRMPPDRSRSMHEIWILCDAVLGGRHGEARQRLERVDSRTLYPVHEFVLALSKAGLMVASRDDPRRTGSDARAVLQRALSQHRWFRKDRLMRRLARKFILLVGRSTGGPSSWLWVVRRLWTTL